MKLDLKNYPLILKIVCCIVLMPIMAAPLILYCTIFIFDNPSNYGEAYLLFFAVNSYSLILVGICLSSVWIYTKSRSMIFASLPFLLLASVIYAGYWYFTYGPIDKETVSAGDYRLYRDTPCEELAKCVNRQDIKKINQILDTSPELLEYKDSKFNQTVFFYAIYDDKFKSAEALLKRGADPNQVAQSVHSNQTNTYCPLSSVCDKNINEEKKIKYVRLLLDYGADINTSFVKDYIDDNKWAMLSTPLSIASKKGEIKLVKFLLKNGADPNYMHNSFDSPPLQTALIFRNFDIAEELLNHGADPDLRFYERNTSVREDLTQDINSPNMCADTDHDIKERKRLLQLIQRLDSIKRR